MESRRRQKETKRLLEAYIADPEKVAAELRGMREQEQEDRSRLYRLNAEMRALRNRRPGPFWYQRLTDEERASYDKLYADSKSQRNMISNCWES